MTNNRYQLGRGYLRIGMITYAVRDMKLTLSDAPDMSCSVMPELSKRGKPLTDAEVAELDSFGELSGRATAPARAIELWEREILYGRETAPRSLGLLPMIKDKTTIRDK